MFKKQLFRILSFFRIIDPYDNNLSISNIACLITLYKLYTAQCTSYEDIGAVMLALSNYSIKKYINKDSINQAAQIANAVTDAANKLTQKEENK